MEPVQGITTADGVQLAYALHRCGSHANPPLVLIHGAASNMTRWSEFADTTALKTSHDLVCPDLRGHGRSLYRGRLSLEVWCDDLFALLRREHYGRAILAGHCLGANVAMMFAARYASCCAGLILVEPMLRPALTGRLRRLIKIQPALQGIIALIRLCNRLGIYRRRLAELDLRALDAAFRRRLAEPDGSEALVQRYASPWQDLRIMPSANFLQDLREVIRPQTLEGIRAPVLALLSTGRTFVDPEITFAALSRLPDIEIHTLPAKHWIPTEQPQVMGNLMEDWVRARAL